MKQIFSMILFVAFFTFSASPVRSQSHELQQLILNIEKLKQLRAILDQLYKGYEIVAKGYNTIKDLSEGNFNLHKLFLDKLLQVSPLVRKYKRVAEIITLQRSLVKEYKAAFSRFKRLNLFNHDDLIYFERVYENLFERSLKNLEELLMVITANQLRMNDAERISAIDQIWVSMQDKLNFLRHFNNNIGLVALQRQQELSETKSMQKIYGIVD
jgi:hypothetical protein